MEKWKKLKDWILSPSRTIGLWVSQPGCCHLMGIIMVAMGNIFKELYICFCSMDFTMAIILLGETLKLLDSPLQSKNVMLQIQSLLKKKISVISVLPSQLYCFYKEAALSVSCPRKQTVPLSPL